MRLYFSLVLVWSNSVKISINFSQLLPLFQYFNCIHHTRAEIHIWCDSDQCFQGTWKFNFLSWSSANYFGHISRLIQTFTFRNDFWTVIYTCRVMDMPGGGEVTAVALVPWMLTICTGWGSGIAAASDKSCLYDAINCFWQKIKLLQWLQIARGQTHSNLGKKLRI